MHQQIRHVIQRLLWVNSKTVVVELSAAERSPLGNLLSRLYYQTQAMDLVDREYRYGYPHNGGQHTFTFRGPPREAVAALELFREVLTESFALSAEESQVAHEFSFVAQEILSRRA